MGSEVLLQSACELSYRIAREGVEAEPPLDPPAAMRSFLYVADLPTRALTVAQQAIEDDPSFRRRVAEHAGEGDVGRAGYLWLHRPIGWAAEFEELSSQDEDGELDSVLATAGISDSYTPEELAADPLAEGGFSGVEGPGQGEGVYAQNEPLVGARSAFDNELSNDVDAEVDVPAGAASALGFGSIDAFGNGEGGLDLSLATEPSGRTEANAIEDELSSLRGLVDRLSSERKAVSTSVRRVEAEVETSKHQPSMFDSDIYSLQSELEAARVELDQARAERDNAVHQRSESLTRQLELEKELERSREQRAELEREHEAADTGMVELRESLARAETSLANLEVERDEQSTQLVELTSANEGLNTQVARITEEQLEQAKSLQADNSALQAEVDGLRIDKDDLSTQVADIGTELNDAQGQLAQVTAQAAEAKSLVDALTEEKIDLASRLADTEAMLETTRVQLSAVKSDSEAVTADLSNIKAHRDGLSAQVEELHGSLSEALNDLARVRSTSDADRASLKEVRAERDLLRVRVGGLEENETGLEAKLTNLSGERDSMSAKAEQLQADLTQSQRDLRSIREEKDGLSEELASALSASSEITTDRDELTTEVEELRSKTTSLEATRDNLQQQVEQLNGENSSIQSQLVEADRLRVEAAENQGHALSELAQRLSMVENERTRLEGDLREAESRISESLVTLETARDEAQRLREENASLAAASQTVDAPFASPSPLAAAVDVSGPDATDVGAPPAPGTLDDTDPRLDVGSADDKLDHDPADETDAIDDSAPIAEGEDGPDPDEGKRSIFGGPADDALPPPPPAPPAVEEVSESAPVETDAAADQGRSSRRSWGIGALRRGDHDDSPSADAPPPPPPVVDTAEPEIGDDPVASDDDDDATDVAAALAETLQDGGADEADVSDDEIDSISTELSQAVGGAKLDTPSDDEDLDEISNLISRTVTDFDPSSLKRPNFEDEPTAALPDSVDGKPGRPRRLFPTRTDDAKGTSGPLPPSVFGDTSDPDEAELGALLGAGDDARPGDDDTATFPASTPQGDGEKVARRQIDIPAEMADDEVEMARHVVSSPDVVLLVDGDSVAKMGWPSLPVAQQRDALVSYLADLSATTGAAPDVVFDGRIGEEESLPASRAVRIRLSTPPTEPAAALDELVDAYPEQWPIAIVTDDNDLGQSAVDRGAVVLNNGQLLDLFIA